jgi:hypothetical protein
MDDKRWRRYRRQLRRGERGIIGAHCEFAELMKQRPRLLVASGGELSEVLKGVFVFGNALNPGACLFGQVWGRSNQDKSFDSGWRANSDM